FFNISAGSKMVFGFFGWIQDARSLDSSAGSKVQGGSLGSSAGYKVQGLWVFRLDPRCKVFGFFGWIQGARWV
ncbi:371_t:CDS:2, partial [Funneliformis geosporum]